MSQKCTLDMNAFQCSGNIIKAYALSTAWSKMGLVSAYEIISTGFRPVENIHFRLFNLFSLNSLMHAVNGKDEGKTG